MDEVAYPASVVSIAVTLRYLQSSLSPEFGISRTVDAFRKPPSPPATGKDILERFFWHSP